MGEDVDKGMLMELRRRRLMWIVLGGDGEVHALRNKPWEVAFLPTSLKHKHCRTDIIWPLRHI